MTISRSWTWQDESVEHDEGSSIMLDALAAEWSALATEIEADGFRRQANFEDGDDPADHFDTVEELRAWQRADRVRSEQKRLRLTIIERMLDEHGARMMRPYEHWNEDERYMQYMESDRFGSEAY